MTLFCLTLATHLLSVSVVGEDPGREAGGSRAEPQDRVRVSADLSGIPRLRGGRVQHPPHQDLPGSQTRCEGLHPGFPGGGAERQQHSYQVRIRVSPSISQLVSF